MRVGEVGAPRPATRRGALVVAIVSLVLLVLLCLGGIFGWWEMPLDSDTLLNLGTMILFLGLGQLILWKAGGNRIGWVFTAIGMMFLGAAIAGGLAERGMLAFEAIGGALWLGWIVLIGTLVLWFPTGYVPSRRWLWLQWLGFGLLAVTVLGYTFTEQLCVGGFEEATGCAAWAPNPIGLPGMPNPEYGQLGDVIFSFYPVFMGGAVLSLFLRYRKAGTIERLQLKWFLFACASFVLALGTELVLGLFGVAEPPLVVDVWISLSIIAIPIAATLAVLRYRLYEIDRIISRTVTYAIVIALLGAVYGLGVTGLTTLLDTDSPLAVAGSTLAAAALFNPLRRRVQRGVDHRFNRTRYDAEQVMAGFTGSLRDEVDPESVVDGWVSVVNETMHPSATGVWVRSES
jgi:hypothetical protein